ncbi:hypothetical protein JCM17478_35400 [Thermopirellula anaerolimosa]
MRFCQLFWYVASQSRSGQHWYELNDADLLELASRPETYSQSAPDKGEARVRAEVLDVLASFSESYPSWTLGWLLVNLSSWGGETRPWAVLYHIEDKVLLAGARRPPQERIEIVPPGE